MDIASYEQYISRFNEGDASVFDDFMAPGARMINGTMELAGVPAIQSHYQENIWPFFEEQLHVERFVADEQSVAVRLWTHFTAQSNAETIFGAVQIGETFDYRGIVMYEIVEGRFARIDVSYLSFTRTDTEQKTTDLGLPH